MSTDETDAALPNRALAPLPQLADALPESQKINLAKFNDEQRQRITDIASTVGVLDSTAVTNYGVAAQRKMNSFLDQLLQGIRTYSVGQAGALTIELAHNIKAMDLPNVQKEIQSGNWMTKVPLVGKLMSALRKFQLEHEEILKHLSEIEAKGQREAARLASVNTKMDALAASTLDNLKELEMYLAAGQVVLMRARGEFRKQKDLIQQSNDPIALVQLRDMAEQINAFEARLMRMHIAYTDALVSIPQIRTTQEAARIEQRNIMDTILFDLPRLKSAILRVAALNLITDAAKDDEARRQITRQIGTIGADALDEAYTRAKQSQGTGAEDVAALAEIADKLLATIEKGVQLDEENRQKRHAAEEQLGEIQDKLMEGLRSNAAQIADRSVGEE
jgi:uncharacterized protein YaaN involved in tellurite resistance